MKKILLYQHGSSYNHGCEALVRTVSQEILENMSGSEVYLSSFSPEEDEIFEIPTVSKIVKNRHWCRHFTPGWFLNRFCPKLLTRRPFHRARARCFPKRYPLTVTAVLDNR